MAAVSGGPRDTALVSGCFLPPEIINKEDSFFRRGLPVAAAAVEAGLMAAEVGEVEGLAAGEAAADQSEVSMRSRDRGSTNHSSPEAVSVEHPSLHLHLLRLEHLAAAPRAAATLEVISQTSSNV